MLALEHGDAEMLAITNKNLDLEKSLSVIESVHKCGIPTITVFVIVGYPGETRARFERSMSYLRQVRKLGGNVRVCVNIAQPYPGTKLLDRCRSEGVLNGDHVDNYLLRKDLVSTRSTVSITTADFDREEVLRRQGEIRACFDRMWWLKEWAREKLPVDMVRHLRKRLKG